LSAQKELHNNVLVCSKSKDPPLLRDHSADAICFVLVTSPCTIESHTSGFGDLHVPFTRAHGANTIIFVQIRAYVIIENDDSKNKVSLKIYVSSGLMMLVPYTSV
jgi:hypothetical protein